MRPPREPSESRSHDSSGAPLGGIVGLTMLERGYEFRCVAFIVAQWFSSALFTDDPNCLSTTSEWECKRHATVRISSWLADGWMGRLRRHRRWTGDCGLKSTPGCITKYYGSLTNPRDHGFDFPSGSGTQTAGHLPAGKAAYSTLALPRFLLLKWPNRTNVSCGPEKTLICTSVSIRALTGDFNN